MASLSPTHQYTVHQNKSKTFNAYGITVSEKDWENCDTFKLQTLYISSEKLDLSKVRTGNIVGFKEIQPESNNTIARLYRITRIEPTKIDIVTPGKPKQIKLTNEKMQLFSIVRDQAIAHILNQPEIAIPSEI